MTDVNERTALYRLYDDDGVLLYVGVSGNPDARFAQHASGKTWWPQVARKMVEWYASRAAAEAAECAAIKQQVPRFNYTHSPEPPTVRVVVDLNAAQARGMDILCAMLSKAAGAQEVLPRADLLWCLLDRELASRGLLGAAPCFYSVIPWPEGVAPPSCADRFRGCRNPACTAPQAVAVKPEGWTES